MALPQQVIDRLSRESPKTPGWSSGMLLFSGGIFAIVLVLWLGLRFGYETYLSGQLDGLNAQVATLGKSFSSDDQTKLVSYYSEIINIKGLLANHVTLSRFLTWLEGATQANIYFTRMAFTGVNNQAVLGGIAKSEADINQQVLIFEQAPEVKTVLVSNANQDEGTGVWKFAMTLTFNPQAVLRAPAVGTP